MILVDANLLIYAHVSDFEQHEAARSWLDERLNGVERVGLAWASLLAFLRLTTNPRVFKQPHAMAQAWKQVEAWLDVDNVFIPEPTERHRSVLAKLMPQLTHANLVPDAHLAALAIEHGLVLCSSDGDFARFANLQWENPLAR